MHQDDSTREDLLPDRHAWESASVFLHVKEMQANIKELNAKMTYHHAVFREEVEKSVQKVYVSAFPDGDPEGHRRHHELVIQREEERVKFWQEMRIAGAKWAGLGILSFLIAAAWSQLLKGPHP